MAQISLFKCPNCYFGWTDRLVVRCFLSLAIFKYRTKYSIFAADPDVALSLFRSFFTELSTPANQTFKITQFVGVEILACQIMWSVGADT